MNYTRAVFLINDQVRQVECTYEKADDAARTAFKTFDETISVDDYVVVPTTTRHGMTVVKVVATDTEPDLDGSADMAWIVGRVEKHNYDQILAQEGEAIEAIKIAEKKRRRDELRKSMMADYASEVDQLQIAHSAGEAEPTE